MSIYQKIPGGGSFSGTDATARASIARAGQGVRYVSNTLGAAPGGSPPLIDDTSAINGDMADFSAAGGGEYIFTRSHLFLGEINTPWNVFPTFRTQPIGRLFDGVDYGKQLQNFFMGPDATFRPGIVGCGKLRFTSTIYDQLPIATNPYPFDPVVMEAALDIGLAMESAGTAFTLDDNTEFRYEETGFEHLSFFGFNQAIDISGGTRLYFRRIISDSVGTFKMVDAGGTPTVEDMICRSALITGASGVTSLSCPILEVTSGTESRMLLKCGAPRTPPTTKAWTYYKNLNAFVPIGTKAFANGNLYRSATSGVPGNTKPSHTAGRVSDGGVVWAYKGPYTDGQLAPADAIPKSTGGFLKAGHPIFIDVDPFEHYTGNPTYPFWNSVGAPASIANFGGDIADMSMRGRYKVVSFGTITSTYFEMLIECPYSATQAAKFTGANMNIQPGSRPGSGVYTDNVDGFKLGKYLGKGPRNSGMFNGSAHEVSKFSSEQPAAGEEDTRDLGSVAIWAREQCDKLMIDSGTIKSMGTGFRGQTGGGEAHQISNFVFQGLQFRAVDMVDGQAEISANFVGTAPVHTRAGAGHTTVKWKGELPPVTGEGNAYDERVTRIGESPAPNKKKRAHTVSGGMGVKLGYGQDVPQYAASTAYNTNALVWNYVFAEDQVYWYRNSGSAGTSDDDGLGPQNTAVGATETDGLIVWTCLGPYEALVALVWADRTANTGKLLAGATGADAPAVTIASGSNVAGRGLQAPRGFEWSLANTANPGTKKGLTANYKTDTAFTFRFRGDDDVVRTLDIPFDSPLATQAFVNAKDIAPVVQYIVESTTRALSSADQRATIVLGSSGLFTLNGGTVGNGFSCIIINHTGADISLTGGVVSGGTRLNESGGTPTKILAGKSTAIEVYTVPASGGTRYIRFYGGTD